MTPDEFNKVVHTRLDKCIDVLTAKAHEYAPDEDRLSNFKKAAALQSCTAPQALMGMMSKHMVALADFCNDPTHYSIEQWREKLGDNINYSLLLEALIMELLEVDIPPALQVHISGKRKKCPMKYRIITNGTIYKAQVSRFGIFWKTLTKYKPNLFSGCIADSFSTKEEAKEVIDDDKYRRANPIPKRKWQVVFLSCHKCGSEIIPM